MVIASQEALTGRQLCGRSVGVRLTITLTFHIAVLTSQQICFPAEVFTAWKSFPFCTESSHKSLMCRTWMTAADVARYECLAAKQPSGKLPPRPRTFAWQLFFSYQEFSLIKHKRTLQTRCYTSWLAVLIKAKKLGGFLVILSQMWATREVPWVGRWGSPAETFLMICSSYLPDDRL